MQGTGKVAFSNYCEDQSEISRETSMGVEKAVADTSDCHNRQNEAHPYDHGSGRDEEMETVLEKHAKFIGQFQAEENAQREWEQKYNEKKIATLVCIYTGRLLAVIYQLHVITLVICVNCKATRSPGKSLLHLCSHRWLILF